MKYTQKKNKQKIKRKNRSTRRRIVRGGDDCLRHESNIDSILNLVFECEIKQHESLFEYDPDEQKEGETGYLLTSELLYGRDDDYPSCLNRNLIHAYTNKLDIYICVVSSGGHSGVCIIFVLDETVHCITYGVNVYTDRTIGERRIAIVTPEKCLITSHYSIILWEKFNDTHFHKIMALYNSSFYIRVIDDQKRVLLKREYSMIPFFNKDNCHTFSVAQVGDINLEEYASSGVKRIKDTLSESSTIPEKFADLAAHFTEGCKDVGRSLLQQCMVSPNRYLNMCIGPVVDLIVLAVKNNCYKESNGSYEQKLRSLMGDKSARVEKQIKQGLNKLERKLRELDRKLREHIVRDTDEAGVTKSATSSVFPFDTTPVDMYDDPIVRYTAESDVTKSANSNKRKAKKGNPKKPQTKKSRITSL
jgi:hypothetical protein